MICVSMLIKPHSKIKVYLLLYVDDMLLAGSSKEDLSHVKDLLNKEIDMNRRIQKNTWHRRHKE